MLNNLRLSKTHGIYGKGLLDLSNLWFIYELSASQIRARKGWNLEGSRSGPSS